VIYQRTARQRLDKYPAHARNNRTNVYSSLLGNSQRANELAWYLSRDSFSVWSAFATIELCFLCVVRAEGIWENTGMGIDFTWVPVWRYMCYSYSNLESVRTNCSYDYWRSNKQIHQSKPGSSSLKHVTIFSCRMWGRKGCLEIIFIIIIINQSITQSSGICTIGQMGKRLWSQYKGLIDT
jgi:hypothetical protein